MSAFILPIIGMIVCIGLFALAISAAVGDWYKPPPPKIKRPVTPKKSYDDILKEYGWM
ncbi:hypothetical protein JZU71_03555 [bacterium]|nr:hypothetical protein [bacterium]